MPVGTAARTPEAPTASAGTKAAYPLRSEIVMLTWGSGMRARMVAMTQPTASPMATPPIAPTTNRRPASASEKLPPTTAATANR